MSKLMALMTGAVAIALAAPLPAAAARVAFDDKEGDAKARFDITRVAFGNGAEVVSAKVRLRDLSTRGTQFFAISFWTQGIEGSYGAWTVRRPGGGVTAELSRFDGDGEHPVDCDVRARWRPGKDLVRLRFPQDCLPSQGRIHVSAGVGVGDGSGEATDWTRTVSVPFA